MNSTIQNEINVGIDTSQAFLDVYIRPLEEYRSFQGSRKLSDISGLSNRPGC